MDSIESNNWTQRREKSRVKLQQEKMELRMQELEHQKQREEDRGERAEMRRIQMEEGDKDRDERTYLNELLVNTLKNKSIVELLVNFNFFFYFSHIVL